MTVTLENPPRNFLDTRMVLELYELTLSLESDRSIGAVVITGAHPHSFVTHYQVAEILAGAETTPAAPPAVLGAVLRAVGALAHLPGGPSALMRTRFAGLMILWRVHQVYLRMNRLDKVFVAAINGFTAAGGCELALACDVRLMADGDFTIGMIEPLLGFNPGGSGGQRLTRAVGPGRAVEMMLEGHMYAPSEAVEAGLVHRVVPAERLLEEAHETAARLARRSPAAIWAVKRAAYEGFSRRWPSGLHLDRSGFVYSAARPATKAAMRLFLEQMDTLSPDAAPSPWADEALLRAWQDGTVADFTT